MAKPRRSAAAVDAALVVVADRLTAAARRVHTATGRRDLLALRRALDTLSRAAERLGPPVADAAPIGFVSAAETPDEEPGHGLDVDYDRGADAAVSRR